jgi:hypothetical protein
MPSAGDSPLNRASSLDRFAAQRPDVVLMAPFLVYLLLLAVRDLLPYEWRTAAAVLRGVGALLVVWRLRHFLPPLGKPHWPIAVVGGLLAAWGWAAGQHWLNAFGVPQRLPLPLFSGAPEAVDPRALIGMRGLFWSDVVSRIAVACIAVPIVEELFWRAFLLRALIRWDHFERVPLGKFTWFSFLGTSLLSTLQHPDNWAVSIACWMFFNGLFYWTRSIRCLILVHAFTNLALYIYAVAYRDWLFW